MRECVRFIRPRHSLRIRTVLRPSQPRRCPDPVGAILVDAQGLPMRWGRALWRSLISPPRNESMGYPLVRIQHLCYYIAHYEE